MKEFVYLKLVARNKRLNSNISVDLFRSLQYKHEITKKKKTTNDLQTNSELDSRLNMLQLPPRGPIIQLDLRPKSAAYYTMLKRLMKPNQNSSKIGDETIEIKSDEDRKDKDSIESEKPSNSDNSVEFNDNLDVLDVPREEYRNPIRPNTEPRSRVTVKGVGNNEAIENLEHRIERWHLELGCKKACVTKLKMIDIDVCKFFN